MKKEELANKACHECQHCGAESGGCFIGYSVRPNSPEAIKNAVLNGANVCHHIFNAYDPSREAFRLLHQ